MDDAGDHGDKQTTSRIVDIAYRQSTAISGAKDTSTPQEPPEDPNFVLANRIMSLPLVSDVTSAIAGTYDTLKTSNPTVESILTATEEKLREGVEILSPVTTTIGSILEEPLKTIDATICDGLDYLGEKIPELRDSTVHYSNSIFMTVKDTFDSLSKEDKQPEIAKNSEK